MLCLRLTIESSSHIIEQSGGRRNPRRVSEGQQHRIAGLNLLTVVIIYRNTWELGEIVAEQIANGEQIDLGPHVSSLEWEHITLTGPFHKRPSAFSNARHTLRTHMSLLGSDAELCVRGAVSLVAAPLDDLEKEALAIVAAE
nr:Tn3 family transposase [Paramesorhizobium deserti]